MADRGFGLSASGIKLVMMRMAAKLGRTVNVKKVYRGFRSRHRELTIRCAEAADRLRCGALTKENMDRHFQNLKEIFDYVEKAQGYPVQPHQVLNLDESCEPIVVAPICLFPFAPLQHPIVCSCADCILLLSPPLYSCQQECQGWWQGTGREGHEECQEPSRTKAT